MKYLAQGHRRRNEWEVGVDSKILCLKLCTRAVKASSGLDIEQISQLRPGGVRVQGWEREAEPRSEPHPCTSSQHLSAKSADPDSAGLRMFCLFVFFLNEKYGHFRGDFFFFDKRAVC